MACFLSDAQLEALQLGQLEALHVHGPRAGDACRRVILPGAFNPLHDGHRRMAELANQILGAPAGYELSIHNVDKPALRAEEIRARLAQFDRQHGVWLTGADTFVKKARVFPHTTFVVGVDTIRRVADVGYYQGSRVERDRALEQLRDRDSRFLVFGREIAGTFCQLHDCQLPAILLEICAGVAETDFRLDVSSRQLRSKGKGIDQRKK